MTSWQEDMYDALYSIAVTQSEFNNDDVFEYAEKNFNLSSVGDRRAYGPVVNRAVKEGIIEWTGRSVVTRRKNCHKMIIRVWKSNIYTPQSKGYYMDYVPEESWWTKFKRKHFDKVW